MLAKRIIPCLDIKDGRTVKGTNFINLRDAGDPVELAAAYAKQGADELVFLDITATVERRKTLAELVKKVAHTINIPFTVGGGIKTVEDVSVLLNNGADKISINTAAYNNPAGDHRNCQHRRKPVRGACYRYYTGGRRGMVCLPAWWSNKNGNQMF